MNGVWAMETKNHVIELQSHVGMFKKCLAQQKGVDSWLAEFLNLHSAVHWMNEERLDDHLGDEMWSLELWIKDMEERLLSLFGF